MIKVKVSTKVKGQEQYEKIRKEIEKIGTAYVTIGVHEGAGNYTEGKEPATVAEVALWTEFGTEKMPARSWMRSTMDEKVSQLNKLRNDVLRDIMEGKITTRKGMEIIGFNVMVWMQNKIKSNVPPALSDAYALLKKREGLAPQTLIRTGLMLRSVTYEVYVDD